MKRILVLASSAVALVIANGAFAADLPNTKGPAPFLPPPAPIFSWTGVYVGIHGGYSGGHTNSTSLYWSGGVTPVPPNNYDAFGSDGWLLGGQVGYNYQFSNRVVVGLEGSLSWTNSKGDFSFGPSSGGPGTAGGSTDVTAAMRGRIGYAVDRFLPYVIGGAVYARTRSFIDVPGVTDSHDGADAWGWTVGAGVEYALTDHVSIRAEYSHEEFGAAKYQLAYPGGSYLAVSADTTENIGLLGINYRF